MITYLASVVALADDPDAQKVHTLATEEILKAFSTLVTAIPEPARMFTSLMNH